MKHFVFATLFFCSSLFSYAQSSGLNKSAAKAKFVLVVHGGAGAARKEDFTPEREAAYRASVKTALTVGYNILVRGGSALDAVERVIATLENDSLFNAGKGAVFAHEGRNELDASIMDGNTLKAGAVAGVTVIKNPIIAARAVMERSPHVMLAGKGAEQFAKEQGIAIVSPDYFRTDAAWRSLQNAILQDSLKNSHGKKKSLLKQAENKDVKYGTVGAVALDASGNLAAGTSTGGMTNKKYGRIGDSPIIGAGTYADNNTCAVSCTGWGEYFIRLVMAKSVSDRMELKGMTVSEASTQMIHEKLQTLGGEGGLIALDKDGNIAMPYNTMNMVRGYIRSDGETEIKMFEDR